MRKKDLVTRLNSLELEVHEIRGELHKLKFPMGKLTFSKSKQAPLKAEWIKDSDIIVPYECNFSEMTYQYGNTKTKQMLIDSIIKEYRKHGSLLEVVVTSCNSTIERSVFFWINNDTGKMRKAREEDKHPTDDFWKEFVKIDYKEVENDNS